MLSDDRLLIREATERLNAELGFRQKKTEWRPRAVWDGEARNLIMRLFRGGQLEREPETFNKTKTRCRYHR